MTSRPAAAPHTPVLMREVLDLLDVRPGSCIVDVTAGAGGHLEMLAEAVGAAGRVIALDRDERAHQSDAAGGVAARFSDRVTLHHASFAELPRVLSEAGIDDIDGLLCDLGVSSMQLDEQARGFSFRGEGPLDMRMDTSTGRTAWTLIHETPESELADIIFQFGDERKSRRIAKVLKRGPLPDSTLEVAEIVSRSVGGRRGRIHPATRTFQALRIATNGELDELDALLAALPGVLAPQGRAAIISFHSLEDRRVKRCFQSGGRKTEDGADPMWRVLTKKPLTADEAEVRRNPRARSAKLRAIERT